MRTLMGEETVGKELRPYDFDTLGRALEELEEQREIDDAISELPLAEEQAPLCGTRATFFVGSANSRATCPACYYDGGHVDDRGRFACENCGFMNTEELAPPRHGRRRRGRLH